MTTQTEAQRLAIALLSTRRWYELTDYDCDKAAAELRRLEAANAELVEAIKAEMHSAWDCLSYHPKMHAAIAKHGGQS